MNLKLTAKTRTRSYSRLKTLETTSDSNTNSTTISSSINITSINIISIWLNNQI